MTPLEIATNYIRRGWSPVPVPFKQKSVTLKGWQNLRITEENLTEYFSPSEQNIGVLLGPASGGLSYVDLDCKEAVALAPSFLPPTPARFGRHSKPQSHWLYRTTLSETEGKAALTFKDPESGTMLVELRLGGDTGAQTVFPGSVHESGEEIVWDHSGEPREIEGGALKRAVSVLVVCA